MQHAVLLQHVESEYLLAVRIDSGRASILRYSELIMHTVLEPINFNFNVYDRVAQQNIGCCRPSKLSGKTNKQHCSVSSEQISVD